MQPFELKEYIYNNDKIGEVLQSIGVHSIKEMPSEFRGGTPEYEGNNNLSVRKNEFLNCSIYTSEDTIRGDIFVLIEHCKGYTFGQAMGYLHRLFGMEHTFTKPKEVNSEIARLMAIANQYKSTDIRDEEDNEQITYGEEFLDNMVFLPYRDYFKEGILASSQRKFGIRFDNESGRVVFPWTYSYDIRGLRYVGASARTTEANWKQLGIAKYMAIPKRFTKSRNLYGYVENYNDIQKDGMVIVFEGEKSVLKADSFLYNCAVAVGSHEISIEQIALLESLNVEIVIAFDKDIKEDFIKETCRKMNLGRTVSYIIDTKGLLDGKDSPVDKGRVIFSQLLNERKVLIEKD